jgi:hypothetical protein
MILKNLISLCCICFFIILAIGSSSTAALNSSSFNLRNKVEDRTVKGNYLVTNEGTKISGKEIRWKSGFLTKDQIIIDGEKYKMADIKGYREDDIYYERLGIEYIRRIVHGKINLYYTTVIINSQDRDHASNISHRSRTRYDYYIQKGDDGPLKLMRDMNDVKIELGDCPLALQMVDMKPSKLRKEIKNDHDYLNKAFEVYNNNCKSTD